MIFFGGVGDAFYEAGDMVSTVEIVRMQRGETTLQ